MVLNLSINSLSVKVKCLGVTIAMIFLNASEYNYVIREI
jgi:hypothetical protein